MPHIPYRVRPLPTSQPQPIRSRAPLATQVASQADLPAIPSDDILDLPMPDAPVRTDRPNVPFAAPRKRERKPSNPLLSVVSMKTFAMSPDAVAKHLFPGSE